MRKRDSIITSLKAFFSLFHGGLFLDELVDVDFRKELMSNEQFAALLDQEREKHRPDFRKRTLSRCKLLRKKIIVSLSWILSSVAIVAILTCLFFPTKLKGLRVSSILGIVSLICFSLGTLGRLGWEGLSWNGDTVFEQLDHRLFWILYFLGIAMGSLAFVL